MSPRIGRRRFLTALGGSGLVFLAGCSSQGSQPSIRDDYGDTPEFEAIYSDTYDEDGEPLSQSAVDDASGFETTIKQIERANHLAYEQAEFESLGASAKTLREIAHNQLGFDPRELRIFTRKDGAGNWYKVIFTTDSDGHWIKHMAYAGADEEGGVLEHGTDPIENSTVNQRLGDLWDQDQLAGGAATAIHTYRKGVEAGGTWEKLSDDEWREASKPLDRANDTVVVGETGEKGDIGYSREAAERLVDIFDFDEVDQFDAEMEFVVGLSTYYYSTDPGDYIHVDVADGSLEDDQRELVSLSDGFLFASKVDEAQHDEDAFNVHIPEEIYQEEVASN